MTITLETETVKEIINLLVVRIYLLNWCNFGLIQLVMLATLFKLT